MAVIKITTFGGLKPNASARALPDDKAQVAENLDPTTAEFRPLANDTEVVAASGVESPLTLWRLPKTVGGAFTTDMSTSWVVRAADMSFVLNQDNADTTQRFYATFNDGTAPPRAYDQSDTVTGRQLGVPKPTTAPVITVDVEDEFTVDERATDLSAARESAIAAIRENVSLVWRGATHPGTGTSGYVDRSTAYGFGTDDQTQMVRSYRLTGAGGTVSDTYVGADAATFSWIFDPQLAGAYAVSTGTPAWAGTGVSHYCLFFTAYGKTYDVDSGAMSTALAAIEMPGNPGTQLFDGGQISVIVSAATDLIDAGGEKVKPMVDELASAVVQLRALLDGSTRGSIEAQVQAFYSLSDVSSLFTNEINTFAKNVFQTASSVVHSSLPADYNAGGGGGP